MSQSANGEVNTSDLLARAVGNIALPRFVAIERDVEEIRGLVTMAESHARAATEQVRVNVDMTPVAEALAQAVTAMGKIVVAALKAQGEQNREALKEHAAALEDAMQEQRELFAGLQEVLAKIASNPPTVNVENRVQPAAVNVAAPQVSVKPEITVKPAQVKVDIPEPKEQKREKRSYEMTFGDGEKVSVMEK